MASLTTTTTTTTTTFLLLIIITMGLFAVTTTARPCKTIFFVTSSTSTTTFFPIHSQTLTQNPNSQLLTFFITDIHQFHRPSNDAVSSKPYFLSSSSDESKPDDESSIDVYSIVGSVLFGVGCGAVTAAVLYLIWSLCSYDNHKIDGEDSDVSDHDLEGDVSKMTNGAYVAVANGAKEVPPTAEEVEAMKGMK